MSKATDYLSTPSMCAERHDATTPIQIAFGIGDLSAELSSLGDGLDILMDDDALTRRQIFILNAVVEKLASIMSQAEELARRADELTSARG